MARAILGLMATILVAAGCDSAEKRFYSGPPLPADREVRVATRGTHVVKVDGKDAGLSYGGLARLAPGDHVLELAFYRAQGSVQYRAGPLPARFRGEAGHEYVAFGVAVNGRFHASIFAAGRDPIAGGDLPGLATGRDRYRSTVVSRGERVRRGGRAVSGVAFAAKDAFWFETRARQQVLLVPKNEASTHWIGRIDSRPVPLGPIGLLIAGGQLSLAARPDSLAGDTLTIEADAAGGFTFYDVTPGDYYAIARDVTRAAVQDVAVGASDVTGVRLAIPN